MGDGKGSLPYLILKKSEYHKSVPDDPTILVDCRKVAQNIYVGSYDPVTKSFISETLCR